MASVESMGFQPEWLPHPSAGCTRGTEQARLDAATTVAQFDRIWVNLARKGAVDAWGGAEYRHALVHLYYAHPEVIPPEYDPSEAEELRLP